MSRGHLRQAGLSAGVQELRGADRSLDLECSHFVVDLLVVTPSQANKCLQLKYDLKWLQWVLLVSILSVCLADVGCSANAY